MCRCKQRDNGPRIERLEKRLYRGAPRACIERSQVQSPARQPARELASLSAAALDKYQEAIEARQCCLIRLRANP
jgi:hypothetical protein